MREAGFTDVAVLRQELIIETPPAETFAPLHLASMPIAQAVRSLPEADRATMMAEIAEALRDHASADGLRYPDAVNVVAGRA